jgi:hypothetical protein
MPERYVRQDVLYRRSCGYPTKNERRTFAQTNTGAADVLTTAPEEESPLIISVDYHILEPATSGSASFRRHCGAAGRASCGEDREHLQGRLLAMERDVEDDPRTDAWLFLVMTERR